VVKAVSRQVIKFDVMKKKTIQSGGSPGRIPRRSAGSPYPGPDKAIAIKHAFKNRIRTVPPRLRAVRWQHYLVVHPA